MFGLAFAALGLALSLITGNPFWDGLASVLIGLVLGALAILLLHEAKSLLIGEAADEEVVDVARLVLRDLDELAGLPDPTDRAAITRCAVESMAASAAQVAQRGGQVVEELGPYIEPVQLQVVCRQLWSSFSP